MPERGYECVARLSTPVIPITDDHQIASGFVHGEREAYAKLSLNAIFC